jgi:hypothetical protein
VIFRSKRVVLPRPHGPMNWTAACPWASCCAIGLASKTATAARSDGVNSPNGLYRRFQRENGSHDFSVIRSEPMQRGQAEQGIAIVNSRPKPVVVGIMAQVRLG